MPASSAPSKSSLRSSFTQIFTFSSMARALLETIDLWTPSDTISYNTDAARETRFTHEGFQGPLIGDLCGLRVSPGSDAEPYCNT